MSELYYVCKIRALEGKVKLEQVCSESAFSVKTATKLLLYVKPPTVALVPNEWTYVLRRKCGPFGVLTRFDNRQHNTKWSNDALFG